MTDQYAFSIPEFCKLHGFSRASYYNMPPKDRPREKRVGKRVIITKEAAAEWRNRDENATQPAGAHDP